MEREQISDRPEAGPGRRYIGHWPDMVTYGRLLAEDLGLDEAVYEIPRALRPYVRVDYAAIVGDMVEVGMLDVVETSDGVHVYELLRS